MYLAKMIENLEHLITKEKVVDFYRI